jgi:hypothetical protein
VSSEQLRQIYNNYNYQSLNQGQNFEYFKVMSPAAGGYIDKKMPYRGIADTTIQY